MRSLHRVMLCAAAAAAALALNARGDQLELLNGTRVQGQVVEETAEAVLMKVPAGSSAVRMRFSTARIHAITVDGTRRVLNERGAPSPGAPKPKAEEGGGDSAAPHATESASPQQKTRSRDQVLALIQQAGSTPPDWWDGVPLDYPKSLDLSWPEKAPGPWSPQKNVGQYLWSVINENPHKWRSGVRFLHYLLTVHKDNPKTLLRVMESLGNAYFNLLQDWARAAFWWRKVDARDPLSVFDTVRLGQCYWRLGSKAMAAGQLNMLEGYVSTSMIKLWSDIGELDKALSMAASMARIGQRGESDLIAEAHLAAGDALRLHGRYEDALDHYQKVLAVQPVGQRKGRIERCHKRAQANTEGIKVFDALDLKRIPNGTYTSSSVAYTGPLQVAVTVKDGRIESVKVTSHGDKQYYGAITETPAQIVEKQGVKGVDAVTCATMTSEAIINATAKALAGGMK